MTEKKEPTRVPADPDKWSQKSKQSLEYVACWESHANRHNRVASALSLTKH